jgi:hypothetical protein
LDVRSTVVVVGRAKDRERDMGVTLLLLLEALKYWVWVELL